jgi:hypothetical protein
MYLDVIKWGIIVCNKNYNNRREKMLFKDETFLQRKGKNNTSKCLIAIWMHMWDLMLTLLAQQ